MKRILVFFPGFSKQIGGSEVLVFLLLHELQKNNEVTLALQHTWIDPFVAAEMYELPLDRSRLQVILLDKSAGFLSKMDRRLKFLWKRRLRCMGPSFDTCISCANPVDFGRPGIHFVFMLSLDNAFKAYIWKERYKGFGWLRNWLVRFRDELARVLAGARTAADIVRDRRETVLPNSHYVKQAIESYYQCSVHEIFYPPTLFIPKECHGDRNLNIVSIGRLGPEKRILEMVKIVTMARDMSGLDFKLCLVGHCSNINLRKKFAELVISNKWLSVDDAIVGKTKADLLASCTFALHCCKVEAFGISITEYLKAGIVPIVPREGGSAEVVGSDDLVYDSDVGAAKILLRLVQDKSFYDKCTAHCRERAKRFMVEAYFERQNKLLNELGLL